MPLVKTIAVKFPVLVGWVVKVTVNSVEVAAVTVPAAPLLKVTVFLLGVVEKPEPLILIEGEFGGRTAVL